MKQLLETDASDFKTGLADFVCQKGHDYVYLLAQVFFIGMSKNFVQRRTESSEGEKEQKKIAKLQS